MKWLLLSVLLAYSCFAATAKSVTRNEESCSKVLGEELIKEIAAYNETVAKILDYVLTGEFKGKTYDELSKFVDKYGYRLSGSETLEHSIDYMIELAQRENLHDITTEELDVPHWVRVHESVTMLQPRKKNIPVLGLGNTINTSNDGVTGEVIVVKDFDHFENITMEQVQGKIVLFVPTYTTYSETVVHRKNAAVVAAKKGAIASLVKSITPFSISSPHTGSQSYDDKVKKIPTAAIAVEDAELLERIYKRGEKIVINIKLKSTYDTKISRNTLIDLIGHQTPEKLVIVSGHIDSWDVGQGAMDDGGGLFISWAAPVVLRRLGLTPKRTVRSIFWTAEEPGLVGAYDYEERHRNESDNINFIMESDEGTFAPTGLEVAGNKKTQCIIAEVLKHFESINATSMKVSESPGSDIAVLIQTGIPGASLMNENEKYFWFHHTEGDTMTVESPEELDLGTAFWTSVAYIIADLSIDIPRV